MKQEWPTARAKAVVWEHQPIGSRPGRPKLVDSVASLMPCCRGQMIYDEGAPVECWYRVVSGTARRFIVRPDGRRQIIDLLLSGDVFGFGAHGSHSFTAEAIRDGTVVARYPRSRLEALVRSDVRIAQEVQEMALEETRRLQDLILILGRTTAQEKVGAFLVHLAERLAGGPADRMILPISRYDIADYLALSVETVSRALSSLKRNGLIKFSGTRQVAIIDRGAIETSSAFGQIGDGSRAERDSMSGSDARIFDSNSFSSSRVGPGGGR
jgi:CRP/FNR family transcriptional regulator, nitrogen fixation regulation protein